MYEPIHSMIELDTVIDNTDTAYFLVTYGEDEDTVILGKYDDSFLAYSELQEFESNFSRLWPERTGTGKGVIKVRAGRPTLLVLNLHAMMLRMAHKHRN